MTLPALDLEQVIWWGRKQHEWRKAYADATPAQAWGVIRRMYRDVMPYIHAASERWPWCMMDPYFVEWRFTPIEEMAWQSIRHHGAPLYPQVPVGPYFIDFASPHFRIGLEVDGAAYHDRAKDNIRDVNLMRQGWKIFRITGAEAYSSRIWSDDMEGMESEGQQGPAWDWLCHSSDGVIAALNRIYFRSYPEQWPFFELAVESLDRHRLAPFSLGTGPVLEAYDDI